jgi:hypothetical protein
MILSLLIVLGAAWLLAGRQLTLLLDRVPATRPANLPVAPLQYDGGGFRIGGLSMSFGALNNLRYPLSLNTGPANRVVLTAGPNSFILGPRTNPADPQGRPEIDFLPEPGDQLSLTSRQSLLSWPTPFEIRILGGRSPLWKRYVHYRLLWKKPSGSRLDMRWRYEQQYYSATGWTEPAMRWNSQTGLLSVEIQPDAPGTNATLADYLARTKGWKPGEYRLESRGPSPDGNSAVFAAIHRDDEHDSQPGAGKSVVLYLDHGSNRVTRELAGQ